LSALSGTPIDALVDSFAGKGYGDLKGAVADVVAEVGGAYRERALGLIEERTELESILAAGAERAREIAASVVAEVYDKVGLLPPERGR
jgi:tryptophanyl-tRNA synthetase